MPLPGDLAWPVEPFQSKFKDAMLKLEMPRFCRRYPKLTDVLLQQMLALVQACPSPTMLWFYATCLRLGMKWLNLALQTQTPSLMPAEARQTEAIRPASACTDAGRGPAGVRAAAAGAGGGAAGAEAGGGPRAAAALPGGRPGPAGWQRRR